MKGYGPCGGKDMRGMNIRGLEAYYSEEKKKTQPKLLMCLYAYI